MNTTVIFCDLRLQTTAVITSTISIWICVNMVGVSSELESAEFHNSAEDYDDLLIPWMRCKQLKQVEETDCKSAKSPSCHKCTCNAKVHRQYPMPILATSWHTNENLLVLTHTVAHIQSIQSTQMDTVFHQALYPTVMLFASHINKTFQTALITHFGCTFNVYFQGKRWRSGYLLQCCLHNSHRKCLTISEVAADWYELMILSALSGYLLPMLVNNRTWNAAMDILPAQSATQSLHPIVR